MYLLSFPLTCFLIYRTQPQMISRKVTLMFRDSLLCTSDPPLVTCHSTMVREQKRLSSNSSRRIVASLLSQTLPKSIQQRMNFRGLVLFLKASIVISAIIGSLCYSNCNLYWSPLIQDSRNIVYWWIQVLLEALCFWWIRPPTGLLLSPNASVVVFGAFQRQ